MCIYVKVYDVFLVQVGILTMNSSRSCTDPFVERIHIEIVQTGSRDRYSRTVKPVENVRYSVKF